MRFSCDEKGIVTNSGSNWVYAVDTASTFLFATKYPIAFNLETFDAFMHQVNISEDSLDSARLMSLPSDENGFRSLQVKLLPINGDGNPLKDGCYKIRLTVMALRTTLEKGDIPNDVKEKIRMEWVFQYVLKKD